MRFLSACLSGCCDLMITGCIPCMEPIMEPSPVQTQKLPVNTQKSELSKLIHFRLVCWGFSPIKSSARKRRPCIKWRIFQCSSCMEVSGVLSPNQKKRFGLCNLKCERKCVQLPLGRAASPHRCR